MVDTESAHTRAFWTQYSLMKGHLTFNNITKYFSMNLLHRVTPLCRPLLHRSTLGTKGRDAH